MRGFIDDDVEAGRFDDPIESQSAFVRGFIDDWPGRDPLHRCAQLSQSAFVRGFIDDSPFHGVAGTRIRSLNPRSCAASSMTYRSKTAAVAAYGLNPRSCAASSMTGQSVRVPPGSLGMSQSAFVRGFIDDNHFAARQAAVAAVSIRVRARLHR